MFLSSIVINYYNYKYGLNTENGGFMPDKSRGLKAPGDLSCIKPMFDLKHDQGGFVK